MRTKQIKILLNIINIVTAMFLIFTYSSSLAAKKASQSNIKTTTLKNESKKAKKFNFSNSLKYSIGSNVIDEKKGQLIRHGIGYKYSFQFLDGYSTSFGINGSYITVDSDVIQNDNGVVDFSVSDVNLKIKLKDYELYKTSKESINFSSSIGNIFPLSERSRDEGYKAVPGISGGVNYSRGIFKASVSGSGKYIINSFDTNISGTSNLKSGTSLSLGSSLDLKYFTLIYAYNMGIRSYVDGTNLGFSENSINIKSYIYDTVSVSMGTSNSNALDDEFVDLWFFDEYQSLMLNLSIGVIF